MANLRPKTEGVYQAQQLTGGLDTKVPPHRLDPSMTPDARNVLHHDESVKKRGGFIPLIKDHPKLNAIRNTGHHGKTVDPTDALVTHDTIIVPGALTAAHTGRYDNLDDFTISFFCQIDDLTKTHSGNGAEKGGGGDPDNPFGQSPPFDLTVRPILSKGPVTRTMSNATAAPTVWDAYGPPTVNEGMIHYDTSNAYGHSGEILACTWVAGNPTTVTTDRVHGLTTDDKVRIIADPSSSAIAGVYYADVLSTTTFDLKTSIGPDVFLDTTGATGIVPITVVGQPVDIAAPDDINAMPFCVYLWRSAAGAEWQFRFSVHVQNGTVFSLQSATMALAPTGISPEIGPIYHVIASCNHGDADGLMLRIGVWNDLTKSFAYKTAPTVDLTSTSATAGTPCPIQVFDCPLEFIEAPSANVVMYDAATNRVRPPGLELGIGHSAPGGGGYWFNSKRFEGAIEDILITSTSLSSSADTSSDLTTKVPIDVTDSAVVNHWSMVREGDRYVIDESGNGNHLFFVPDGPITDGVSGGVNSTRAKSWWFNGQTSYVLADCENNGQGTYRNHDNPNWRYRDSDGLFEDGAWQQAVREGTPYGCRVDFWVDSEAEPFEQVLVEAHSVMRIAIRTDGRITAMFRDDTVNTATVGVPKLGTVLVSDYKIKAGTRYSVTVIHVSNAQALMRVNGLNQTLVPTPPVETGDSGWPISGLTFGMGSKIWTNASSTDPVGGTVPVIPTEQTAEPNQINTDPRSAFCGRIEVVELLLGQGSNENNPSIYRDSIESDWRDEQSKLWDVPRLRSTPTSIEPSDPADSASGDNLGRAISVGKHVQNGRNMRYISTNSVAETLFTPGVLPLGSGGADELDNVRVELYKVFARWVFDQDDEDVGLLGYYLDKVEYRPPRSGNSPFVDRTTLVHVQESVVTDALGVMSGVQRRCVNSDSILEDDVATYITSGSVNAVRGQDYSTHRVRPYPFRSPWEIGPQWCKGLATPVTGTNGLSLLADWQHQESDERFLVTAAGRQVYWAKPMWRAESPFDEATPMSVWCHGTEEDYIVVDHDVPAPPVDYGDTTTIDFWVKPYRLDGTRLLCAKGSPSLDVGSDLWNFMIVTDPGGALYISGTENSGANTWQYGDTSGPASTATPASPAMLKSRIKANAWNHIYVLIGELIATPGTEGVVAWVNGVRLDLEPTALGGLTAAAADGSTDDIYLCGLPVSQRVNRFSDGLPYEAFSGLMTEFRIGTSEEGRFPSTAGYSGVLLRERHSDSATVAQLLHMNEGSGWSLSSSAATNSPDGAGLSQMRELIPIAEGLGESSDARYDFSVFRDKMYICNERSFPQEIQFTRYSDPEGPFLVNRMGMEVGGTVRPTELEFRHAPVHADSSSLNYLQVGLYDLWVSFLDKDGRESEPLNLFASERIDLNYQARPPDDPDTEDVRRDNFEIDTAIGTAFGSPTDFGIISVHTPPVAGAVWNGIPDSIDTGEDFTVVLPELTDFTPTIPAGTYVATKVSSIKFEVASLVTTAYTGATSGLLCSIYPDGIYAKDIPRSIDPQVTGRRFYFSPTGGGPAVFHSDINDNDSREVELFGGGTSVKGVETARRLPAPRAKHIEVITGNVVLANSPDVAAGRGAFFWSDGEEPIYFPLSNATVIDSRDGKEIVGIKASLGNIFFFKRDSTWQFSFRGVAIPGEAPLFLRPVNQSVGLGGGVTLYDNIAFGAGERGVYRFDGSNVAYASEALEGDWRDLPDISDKFLTEMFGGFYRDGSQFWLSIRGSTNNYNDRIYALHIGVGDKQVWSRLDPPAHRVMNDITHPVSQRPKMTIGTTHGQILVYDENVHIDGHGDELFNGTKSILSGSALGQLTSLTISSGFFDTTLSGLRGVGIEITYLGVTYSRVIESNALASLSWRDPLPVDPAGAAVTFVIGGYRAYWTSPWIGGARLGSWMQIKELDLEFSPNSADLVVDNVVAINAVPTDRAMPTAVETRDQDMTTGFQDQPNYVKTQNHGRFFRVQFSTDGIRAPFEVTSWGFRGSEEGTRGRPR